MTTQEPRTVKRLGWVLLILGLFLLGGMGALAWHMYPSMSHPGVTDASGTTFTGTADQAHDALQLFVGVMAFGALSILNGVWQIATGRRSIVFVAMTMVVAAALFFGARGMMAPGGSFSG
ncbi:hypothetical protein [Sphingomonas sp.]|uniref:hypothetical protein n=1 Tax=Sphingomonas sp. TaxID=28214 RepID=UPI003AFF6442